MFETAVEVALAGIRRYGLIVLFVAFVFEGAIVGKVIPTRALFVAALLFVGGTVVDYLSAYVVGILGATIGQAGVFGLVRYYDVRFEQLGFVPINDEHVALARQWFERYGIPAVAVSNVLPVMRGTMTVPVAMSNASVARFLLASAVGTAAYLGALSALAMGVGAVLL